MRTALMAGPGDPPRPMPTPWPPGGGFPHRTEEN